MANSILVPPTNLSQVNLDDSNNNDNQKSILADASDSSQNPLGVYQVVTDYLPKITDATYTVTGNADQAIIALAQPSAAESRWIMQAFRNDFDGLYSQRMPRSFQQILVKRSNPNV